jgi:hypothetical protein
MQDIFRPAIGRRGALVQCHPSIQFTKANLSDWNSGHGTREDRAMDDTRHDTHKNCIAHIGIEMIPHTFTSARQSTAEYHNTTLATL